MKRATLVIIICLLALSNLGAAPPPVRSIDAKLLGVDAQSEERRTMIIRFSSAEDLDEFRELPAFQSRALFRFLSPTIKWIPGRIKHRFEAFSMMAVELTGPEAARLASRADVVYIEPDYTYELLQPDVRIGNLQETPAGEYQYGLGNMGVTAALHDAGYTGKGMKVAVIDSGIDSLHQDLHVAGGWNFVGDSIYYGDGVGHGTHVGGIIAAQRNGFGVVGVAPDAQLYSLLVCTILGCSGEAIINSMQWSLDHGVDIINLSLGGTTRSAAMEEVMDIAYARGVLVVAAAGNQGRSNDSVLYPAKFDSVVAVSAVDAEDEIATFSSRGPAVELAAPGVDVYSTFMVPYFDDHYYAYLSGTSMASPHIAGLAALIMQANPGISNAEVRQKMALMARDLGAPGRDTDYGWGLAQLDRPTDHADVYTPAADAGGPYRGAVGEAVPFNGEGTIDLDDNVLRYEWDFGDGSGGQGVIAKHVYDAPGDYVATLRVSDRDGLQDSARADVSVRAGVVKELRIGATDAGFLRGPADIRLGRNLIAGVSLNRNLHGVALFQTPGHDDAFLLSLDLVLTGATDRNLPQQGTIRAGLLPGEIAAAWPDFTFNQAATAPIHALEPEIVLSYLSSQVGPGIVNPFTAPYDELAAFEAEFATGAMAFRVDLQADDSASMTWSEPVLVIRYIDHVSQAQYPPVVNAGPDQRAHAGSGVILDGSGTFDPEGDELSYQWVQTAGSTIAIQSARSPVASFVAPAGDDILVFELRVSDGVFSGTDQTKVFLNRAPAEINSLVLRPGFGHAGYVHEYLADMNFFDKPAILSGIQDWLTLDDTDFRTFGVLQFDLSDIPSRSQVISAKLELTGAWKWVGKPAKFQVVVLEDSIDPLWEGLNYATVVGTGVSAKLFPELSEYDLGENVINSFNISQDILEERRGSTDRITLRIDGPRISLGYGWMWFTWWSGNRADTASSAPRLIVEYAALEPVVPTLTPTGTPITELATVTPTEGPTSTAMPTVTATPTEQAPTMTPMPTQLLPTPTGTPTPERPTPTEAPTTEAPTPMPTHAPTEEPPTATSTATKPPGGNVTLSITRASSTTIDFAGWEYYTARQGIHGNTGVSPLEIGDARYEPSGRMFNSGWIFNDGRESVDEGARYLVSQLGNAWNLRLMGDDQPRAVKIYVTVNHNARGSSAYRLTAGGASETLIKADQYRSHYEITVIFLGEVEVRMETIRAYSDAATFWLAGAVECGVP
jgi:subtilisin